MARSKQPVVGPRPDAVTGAVGQVQPNAAGGQGNPSGPSRVPSSGVQSEIPAEGPCGRVPAASGSGASGPLGVSFYRPPHTTQAVGNAVPVFRPQAADASATAGSKQPVIVTLTMPGASQPPAMSSRPPDLLTQLGPSAVGAFQEQSGEGGSFDDDTTVTESEVSGNLESGAVVDPGDPEWGSRKRQRTAGRPSGRALVSTAIGISGERRANRLWRQHYNNDLLKMVLQNVKRKIGHSKVFPFLTQVDLTIAPDYHQFVKPEDEMWLHQVSTKLRNLAYSDRIQFLTDIETIRDNCIAYNSPECGKYGGPALVDWAHELVTECKQELETSSESLIKAEKAIGDPECAPPYREAAPDRIVTTRVVSQVPLPAGFKHTLRLTDSKPLGWVQYEASCPVHNCVRTADRVAKLVDIFKAHSHCREEWKEFAQKPDEPFTVYTDRLKQTFTFQKGQPPNTPSVTLNILAAAQARPAQQAAAPIRHAVDLHAAGASRSASPGLAALPQPAKQPAANGWKNPVVRQEHSQQPSYQTAFKRVEEPLRPAVGPPSAPISWPSRSLLVSVPQAQLAESGSPAGVVPRPASMMEQPPVKDFKIDASRADPVAAAQAAVADQQMGEDDVAANARQRVLLELQRYREERANGAAAPSASGTGVADQSWSRQNNAASSSKEEEGDTPGMPNGHAGRGFSVPVTLLANGRMPSPPGNAFEDDCDVPEWSGTGRFPRQQEVAFLKSRLSTASPSSILLLSGPPGSGKSSLLREMQEWWTEDQSSQFQAPWLQWDCHTACADSSHFAKTVKAAVAEFARTFQQQTSLALPTIRDRDYCSCIKAEDWIPSQFGTEDLGQTLGSLANWWGELKTQNEGRRLACLVLDSAHKLKASPWAQQLFNGLEQFVRQGVHVVLTSSDCTFKGVLANAGIEVTAETVGNLPPKEARAFLSGLLQVQPAPIKMRKDWREIHLVCGGNMGLLKHCLQSAVSYQGIEPALRLIWRDAGSKIRRGLDPSSSLPSTAVAHTREHYSTAVGAILESPYRAVSATELEDRLRPHGAAILQSLAAAGLLSVREASGLARDIPATAFGPLQDRVITLPSAAHAYFWNLLSKASADAFSHGIL